MDLSKLSKEEKEKLLAELQSEKQTEKEKKQQDVEAYKKLKDETIRKVFDGLRKLSETMMLEKEETFMTFGQIIAVKNDLFNSKSDRQSDTFSNEDGSITIKIGNRMYEGWDDTVNVGVEKVKNYLKTLATDEATGNLVDTVMRLLSTDRKGNLKANKVLELEQLALKSRNEDFIEAIQIIKLAYHPVPSCQFIEVRYKDEKGNEISLPLSMSAIN
jgi:hypothetical protein